MRWCCPGPDSPPPLGRDHALPVAAFIFERRIPTDELRETFARLLKIPASQVGLLSDDGPSSGVVLHIVDRDGEFVQDVTVYLDGSHRVDREAFAASVVAAFATRALISDDSVNPYSMILIAPGVAPTKVYLEVESLDEHERLKIDRAQAEETVEGDGVKVVRPP